MFKNPLFLILFTVFFILPIFVGGIHLYTDWLFFVETGYEAVFTKTLLSKVTMAIAFGGVFLAFGLANVTFANRQHFPQREYFSLNGVVITSKFANLERVVKPLSIVAVIMLSIMIAQWGYTRWEEFLLFSNAVSIGKPDPILKTDISFYLFKLAFLQSLQSFVGFGSVSVLLILLANYILRGGVLLTSGLLSIKPVVLRHLAVLVSVVILNFGFGFYLSTYSLLLSSQGVMSGPGYADVNAKLISLQVLAVTSVLTAIMMPVAVFIGRLKLAVLAPASLVVIYLVGVVAYPSLLQKFKVAPNELALETPYITHGITFTRKGYDLDRIEVIPFDVHYNLTARDIEKNDATIKNIRLWDHAPLLKTYSQLQQIRTYYKFADVDNDRYTINGQYMQVMLSPRELSYADLPSKSWINERLIFTHGNGIALGPVSKITKEGLPEFIIKDIPASSPQGLKVTRPEIYYGELSNDYVIVKTKVPEFSYPTSTDNIYTTYSGLGGVQLDSIFKRAIFSVRFGTEKILLSTDITSQSKILYYRNILERVRVLAPFLLFDKDPYLVLTDDGRLMWIIDAYTVSNKMPYSKLYNRQFNYIRNSVKAVVDAYSGTVQFYITDHEDAVVNVYSRIFPSLFKAFKDMPPEIRSHIRYPQMLLQIQASMFASYHMTDPKVFYNKENLWEIPTFNQKTMEPYYTIMKLPEGTKEEYILLLPFVPAKRDNLAAWLSARCDGDNYGKLIAYTFPRDRLVYGPKQIDARINQDSYISQQLTLWGQRGSQVIRGSLLVIPIERSLLYVQPLYLAAADKAGLPELRRVIVAYENEVVMEEDLETALSRLFGSKKTVPKSASATTQKLSSSELAKEALKIYEKSQQMLRQGNWAGFGEELRKLEQTLRQLAN